MKHQAIVASSLLALALGLPTAVPALGATVVLEPSQDNSIFGDLTDNSNALGPTLFVGRTGSSSRRALLAFDIAGNIPAGSTITSVKLDVEVVGNGFLATLADSFGLHRLTQSWGEATSFAPATGGTGDLATVGDATWNARFYSPVTPTLWSVAGGTFNAASAVTGLPLSPALGTGSWASTALLVADVQDMLDNPGSDHGWIIVGHPGNPVRSARRLASREEAVAAQRPKLTVEYSQAQLVASLVPDVDTSIYQNPPGNSNALGDALYCGRTGSLGSRRALVRFDIDSVVPAGSTIISAELRVSVRDNGPSANVNDLYKLHRVTKLWGEGTSNAPYPGGTGAAATAGDADWTRSVVPGTNWVSPGGDFVAAPSSSVAMPLEPAGTAYPSTPALVADVQDMLDNPAGNFGWILIGNEVTTRTARALHSGEAANPATRPTLVVQYSSGGGGSRGAIPDGDDVPGVPLTVSKTANPDIRLDWSALCKGDDTDYAVYEGTIAAPFDDHQFVVCTTGGALTKTLSPGVADAYYLVVPNNGADEGSYGDDSGNNERPPSFVPCFPQDIGAPVCP